MDKIDWKIDIVLSHTAPLCFEPTELFLPFINQTKVDKTMECWLDSVEKRLDYHRWYFGHYHGDKKVNEKVKMLFTSLEELPLN